MDWIFQPWPWYIAGPLIGLTVPILLLLSGKELGISSSFRHLCSLSTPQTKLPYLRNHHWRQESWNLLFVAGILVGGAIASQWLSSQPIAFLPPHYYSAGGVLKLVVGGILVSFGTQYARGCTSGHTIMGLSALQWPSLVASICFFIGGLVMTALGFA